MKVVRFVAATGAIAIVWAALALPASAADPPTLTEGITAGVVRTNDGFGTSVVAVPKGGYVTYIVQGPATLAGQTVQIWKHTLDSDWTRVTSRTFDATGTARYFARITELFPVFRARYQPAEGAAIETSGLPADYTDDGSTVITVPCRDFGPAGSGSSLVERTLAARVGTRVTVRLCTDYRSAWSVSAVSSRQLVRVGYNLFETDTVGTDWFDEWTFRLRAAGTGVAFFEFARTAKGADTGTRMFVVRVN